MKFNTETEMRTELESMLKHIHKTESLMSTCCSADNCNMGIAGTDITFMDAEACPECHEPCGFVYDEDIQAVYDEITALLATNVLTESFYCVRENALSKMRS